MTEFTPISALIGGGLIGLGATMLMLGLGRVAGMSGILANTVMPSSLAEFGWRAALLAGVILAAVILAMVFGVQPNVTPPIALPAVIGGGLLVGVGVSLANGCTSGHGICGLASFSLRSLVAVCSFMAAGFVTVFVIRHVLGA